jgi:hypothetical protein
VTSVWTRHVTGEDRLPSTFETTVRLSLSVYQTTANLSLALWTRDSGRQPRPRPLWNRSGLIVPETYDKALQGLSDGIAEAFEKLHNGGLG